MPRADLDQAAPTPDSGLRRRLAGTRRVRLGALAGAAALVVTGSVMGAHAADPTPARAGDAATTRASTGAPARTTTPTAGTPAAPVEQVVRGSRFRAIGPVTAPPKVRMTAWAVADMDTGAILTVHGYRQHLPQASTIKLLTAVTAADRVPAGSQHRVTRREAHPQYCTCVGLRVGKRYTRATLMTGMLLPSGNDAAEALAGSDPHGRAAFVRAMNAKARALGATDTTVVTPSGLTAAGAHSSARDLLVFLRAAQADPTVEPFLRMRSGVVKPLRGRSRVVYRATDYVNKYPTAQGKSGYTTPARNTLVVATPMLTADGTLHRIGVATLGAPGGYSTKGTRALTEWAARNYAQLGAIGQLPAAPGPVVGAQAALTRK